MRARSVVLGLVSVLVACAASAQQRLGPPTEDNPVRQQPADPAVRLGDTPRMIVNSGELPRRRRGRRLAAHGHEGRL
jgi:hypothetical protein